MLDALALLALLIGLELVLGVDNILVLAILVERLPEKHRKTARMLGLALAFFARVALLFIVLLLAGLTTPLFLGLSIRDMILLAGGMFLIWKAVSEIHATVELKEEDAGQVRRAGGMWFTIFQIMIMDIVFSVDSVITSVGLTDKEWIIITAVLLSFIVVLAFAAPIGNFILTNPTIKILALAFLITIGITIFMEGMHKHVPKAYIYLPMGFALGVELLQLRYLQNMKRKKTAS
jgi:predicted tellurium resistance membrane protein TerC